MAKQSAEDRALEQLQTVANDMKVLQDHGEGCACWECARANDTIRSTPEKIVSIAHKLSR